MCWAYFFSSTARGSDRVYTGVAQAVELAGAVAGLLVQQLHQIVADGAVVVGVHILLDYSGTSP